MPSSRPVLLLFLAVLVLVAALLAFLIPGGPIDPLAWEPPEAPAMTGPLAPNEILSEALRLVEGRLEGAEDLAIDAMGRLYTGTLDGRILRLDGETLETLATTGGRPLGVELDAAGALVIADADLGLLRLTPAGDLETLTDAVDGLRFAFTDDLDIASDGRIYFSDASSRFGSHEYLEDCLEARPHGRLLRYDPATRATEVLLDGLYFANGVALSQDEDFVLVNETYRYRITRFWLKGPRAGSSDVFLDNLPGFPDNVSANRRGTFWVACFTVRNARMDRLHRLPFVKRQMAKLPKAIWPKPQPYGLVLGVDESGRITRTLQDPTGERIPQVTSATEHDGYLYLGNLNRHWIGRVALAP